MGKGLGWTKHTVGYQRIQLVEHSSPLKIIVYKIFIIRLSSNDFIRSLETGIKYKYMYRRIRKLGWNSCGSYKTWCYQLQEKFSFNLKISTFAHFTWFLIFFPACMYITSKFLKHVFLKGYTQIIYYQTPPIKYLSHTQISLYMECMWNTFWLFSKIKYIHLHWCKKLNR